MSILAEDERGEAMAFPLSGSVAGAVGQLLPEISIHLFVVLFQGIISAAVHAAQVNTFSAESQVQAPLTVPAAKPWIACHEHTSLIETNFIV